MSIEHLNCPPEPKKSRQDRTWSILLDIILAIPAAVLIGNILIHYHPFLSLVVLAFLLVCRKLFQSFLPYSAKMRKYEQDWREIRDEAASKISYHGFPIKASCLYFSKEHRGLEEFETLRELRAVGEGELRVLLDEEGRQFVFDIPEEVEFHPSSPQLIIGFPKVSFDEDGNRQLKGKVNIYGPWTT